MKGRLFHPSARALNIHIYVLVILLSVLSFLAVTYKSNEPLFIVLAVIEGLLFLLYFSYIVMGLLQQARRVISEFRGKSKDEREGAVKRAIHARRIIMKMVTAFFGALANFALACFYSVYAFINGTYFYCITAALYMFAFSSRIYLMSFGIELEGDKSRKALLFASIFTILIGLSAAGISTYIYLGMGSFRKSMVILIAITVYTILKLVSAVWGFHKARRKHSLDLLSYAEISLSLALFSLFVLQVEYINAFSSEVNMVRFAFSGMIVCVIILSIGIFGVVASFREKRRLRKNESKEKGRLD